MPIGIKVCVTVWVLVCLGYLHLLPWCVFPCERLSALIGSSSVQSPAKGAIGDTRSLLGGECKCTLQHFQIFIWK